MSQSNSMDLWELANVMSIVFLKHIKKREEGVVAWQLKVHSAKSYYLSFVPGILMVEEENW